MPTALELGMQALREGQPTRAASFFEFALKKAPSDPAIRLLAVDAYIQAGMFAAAESHVRQILDQGDVLYQRGEYELLARARSALARIEGGKGRAIVQVPPETGPDVGREAGGTIGPETAHENRDAARDAPREMGPEIARDAPCERAPEAVRHAPVEIVRETVRDAPPGNVREASRSDPSRVAPPFQDDEDAGETVAVDLSLASDFGAIQARATATPEQGTADPPGRARVMACPWCTRTVLLDALFAGRCQCGWFQPARGSRLYIGDLQRLCADRKAVLYMKVHQDIFVLDGRDVRLRLLGRKTIKIDPRLAFELDLGHAVLFPDQLGPIQEKVHPTAVFRLLENYQPEVLGAETITEGQFYSFSEMVDRLEVEYPDCLGLMPRDIHYPYQLSWHLPPDLRQKADEQLAAGARSYGRCLLYAGMTMEDLLRMVPGWQVLRPVGGGHGRLEGVKSLIRKGFITEEEAVSAITKARGRDSLQALVEARLITREVADDVLADLSRQPLQPPLRDDLMERLCRRGVISRVSLVRAGLVLGLVDFDAGSEAEGLAGTMDQIPPEEIEREKQLLAKKEALRRSERLALGKILVDLGFCTRQKIADALARQLHDDSPLGEILVSTLAITPEQLTVALAEQEQRIEALISPRTEPGSEEPVPPPLPAAEPPLPSAPAARPTDTEREAKVRKAGGPAEEQSRRKKARSGGPPRIPPWMVLGGAGALAILLGVAITLAVLHRPRVASRTAVLPTEEPAARTEGGGLPEARPRSRVEVPWRGPDGRYLEPLTQTDRAKIVAEITRIQIEQPGEHIRLARLYRALGDRRMERARIEAALRRDPKRAPVLVQAAFMRLEDGAIGESLALARRALEADPDDPLAHVVMGAVWLSSGNEYEAGREFDQARALEPRLEVVANVSHGAPVATGGVALAAPGLNLVVKLAPER